MMLFHRVVAVIGSAAALVGAAACSSSSTSGSADISPPPTASTTVSAPATTAGGSDSAGPSFVSGGAALADTGHLVYVLEAVNPRIGTNKRDLIAKSTTLCTHIAANESETRLEAEASKTFTNGSWVPSEPEAQAIVGTVKAYGGC